MAGARDLLRFSETIRILYVEDDQKLREDTLRLLSTFFKQIIVTENGRKALEYYQPEAFDLVISDFIMPELNGMELAKQVKQQDPEQIFIVLSAHDEQQYVDELKAAGVNDFIFKPLNIQQFIEVIYKSCLLIEERRV